MSRQHLQADQILVIGGTLDGKRVVSEPLRTSHAIMRFQLMQKQGYRLLTMTDVETGEDYNVGGFISWSPTSKQ